MLESISQKSPISAEPPKTAQKAEKRLKNGQKMAVAPPSIRLWILKVTGDNL